MTDAGELLEQFLEHTSAAGIDLADKGGDRWRGDCPACGGSDRLTVEVRHDGAGLFVNCWSAACETEHVLEALGLGRRDLRVESESAMPLAEDLRHPELANARPITWAWQDRIIVGRLSLLVGNEGSGKGTMIADLAAKLTRGELAGDLLGTPANVLVVGSEDLLDDAWTPRLHLAKADFARVLFQAVGDDEIDFTNETAVEHLRGWIRRYQIKVVVFDALLDHLGAGSDEFKPKSVRGALRPLRRLAGEEQIAALGSLHPRKGRVDSFRELAASSHQFNAISRSSLLLAPHPETADRRLVAVGKSNHAGGVPTLEFKIEVVDFTLDGGREFRDVRAVEWKQTEITLDEVIRASTGVKDRVTKTAAAEDLIVAKLQDGARASAEVKAEVAAELGCGPATVDRSATDLRDDGVLASEGSTTATTWFLTSLGNSHHGSRNDDVRRVEGDAPEERESPANGLDTPLSEPPPALASHHHFVNGDASSEPGCEASEGSRRRRAL